MNEDHQTKAHLIHELAKLRQKVANLEELAANQQRLEAALRESEERFRQWSEATFEGVAIHDRRQILDANLKMAEAFGYQLSEFIGQNILDLIAPKSRDLALKNIVTEYPDAYEAIGLRKGGMTFPLEIRSRPIPYRGRMVTVSVIRDITAQKQVKTAYRQAVIYAQELRAEITERKRAEEIRTQLEQQLLHLQKLEAVGQLAGGVAHDFNNLLTAILGYAGMALAALPADHPAGSDIQGIQNTVQRAANLTRQLLAFARRQIINPQIVNLNDIVLNINNMLNRLIGEDIKLTTTLAPDLAPIKADPGQLEQVLVNLAVNARDAMPNGGELIIETANVTLDHQFARRHLEVTPGEYILLAVTDTGIGMTEEVKARLFEPFFTTKEVGKGTGLGLATCFGIVKQSGGHIRAYSELGEGTTFKIYLPRVGGVASPLPKSEPLDLLAQGSETILLAEDEAAVRDLAARALRQQGYTVLEAATGQEALRLAQLEKEIHLLVTDMVMPKMGGTELADRLKAVRPQLKVVFMSGYTDSKIIRYGLPELGISFLQKPFSAQRLIRKVRDILDMEETREQV
ncbi:MAG: hybrid sensor histidine kinase/response regulator [Anaerolineae bacterium]|nr:response regulator [Anaerolineales bacterium]MCQ3979638.1 hybrid sensor histidine kinase/response regulator [Anaerolineae bacterium]